MSQAAESGSQHAVNRQQPERPFKVVRLKAPAEPAPERRLVLPLAPALERRRLQIYLLELVVDGLLIFLSFAAAGYLYLGQALSPAAIRQAELVLPLYWTAALVQGTYSVRSLVNLRYSQWRAVVALLAASLMMLIILFFARMSVSFSRVTFALGLGFSAALLIQARSWFRSAVRARVGTTAENVLVIDDGGEAVRIPHAFHVDARQHKLAPDLHDPHMLDRVGLFMTNMDRVLVSCPRERRVEWAMVFKGANVQGEVIDPEVMALGALGARRGGSYGSLIVSNGPLGIRARATKRAFDMLVSCAALLLLSPLLLTIAALIKLEDGGPVFFVQQRTGRNNRFFNIFKFRSMRVEKLDANGTRSASKDDDRITRIGRFIRQTSIDELPQLLNVIRGEMSIAGGQVFFM